MAIEKLKRVWIICSREVSETVLKKLYSLRVVHLQRADASEEAVAEKVTRFTANFEDADARVARLKSILALFDAFSPSAKDFLTNMLSLPMEIDVRRVREALETLNEEELAETCAALSQEVEANQKRLEQIAANLSTLTNFHDLDVSRPLGADRWGDVTVQLGFVSPSQAAPLNDSFNAEEWGAMEELGSAGSNALVAIAYLPGQTRAAHDLMGRSGFDPLTIPAEADSLADYVRQLSDEQERLRQRQDEIAAEVERLSASREDVTAALAAAENELVRIRAIEHVAVTGRMGILRGYVREKDADALDEEISKLLDVAAVYEDAKPGEAGVPISLVQSRFFRPGQFLIKMFGVPRYGALDPSPYVLFTFLLFFGFCFGDVLYGLGLIAMGGLLARKLRDYPGLKDFFTLFAYAGVSSVIIGALTGSWAADLFKYLGPLESVRQTFAVFDPLAKPVIALLMVIGIGVANQLYAMVLRIADAIQQRDPMGAVDGILWLMFLPGLILVLAAQMMGMPGWVGRLALMMLSVSAIGLVLTQGREQDTFTGKAISGVVSLYGIIGSYGGVTFIGDILSYSRLLALGLTTYIVGISFNIIADLVGDVPYGIGIVLFTLVVIVGHVFNFFIGILGAFVHSGRLVFVEFFGRFYNAEGRSFEPYGPMEERVKVIS